MTEDSENRNPLTTSLDSNRTSGYVNSLNIPNSQQQAATGRRLRAELQEHAAKSIQTLRAIVDDDKAANRDRIAAARMLTSIAGYVAPKAQAPRRLAESPAEMSSDELRMFIEKAERELAGRAAPVNAQPMPDPPTQVADMAE